LYPQGLQEILPDQSMNIRQLIQMTLLAWALSLTRLNLPCSYLAPVMALYLYLILSNKMKMKPLSK
jgi:hypothetical protein